MTITSESDDLFPGLNTMQDRLRIARKDAEEYLADPLDVDKAEAFARSTHILFDWVTDEYSDLGYGDKESCSESIYRSCPNLKAIRDFSNRAKHGGRLYENRKPYLKNGKRRGGFSRAFSRGFQWARLQLVLKDGTVLNYEDVVDEVIRFWEDFFVQHNL